MVTNIYSIVTGDIKQYYVVNQHSKILDSTA